MQSTSISCISAGCLALAGTQGSRDPSLCGGGEGSHQTSFQSVAGVMTQRGRPFGLNACSILVFQADLLSYLEVCELWPRGQSQSTTVPELRMVFTLLKWLRKIKHLQQLLMIGDTNFEPQPSAPYPPTEEFCSLHQQTCATENCSRLLCQYFEFHHYKLCKILFSLLFYKSWCNVFNLAFCAAQPKIFTV